MLLVIYACSDSQLSSDGYINIGYGLGTVYILMIINGCIRFIYLAYNKAYDFITGRYDYGDKG